MGEGEEEREGGTNGRKRGNDGEKIKRNYLEQNILNVLCVCACVRVCMHCRAFLTPSRKAQINERNASARSDLCGGARVRHAVCVGWTPLRTNLD